MLTIFAIPKSFEGHIGVIQRNAIKSWSLLEPRPEIILFGREPGTKEICQELGLIHAPDVAYNEFQTPLVNDLFIRGQKLAHYSILAYVNADIILLQEFTELVERMEKLQLKEGWLAVARRREMDITRPIEFTDPEWKARLTAERARNSKIGGGCDTFLFTRGLFHDIPLFALGRSYWDCWLLKKARRLRVPIFETTEIFGPIHQNHDYHFLKRPESIETHHEVRRNYVLNGGWTYFFELALPTHKLTPTSIEKIPFRQHLIHVPWRLWAYLLNRSYYLRRRLGLYSWWKAK